MTKASRADSDDVRVLVVPWQRPAQLMLMMLAISCKAGRADANDARDFCLPWPADFDDARHLRAVGKGNPN